MMKNDEILDGFYAAFLMFWIYSKRERKENIITPRFFGQSIWKDRITSYWRDCGIISSQLKKQYVWGLCGERGHDTFEAVKQDQCVECQVKGMEVLDEEGDSIRGQIKEGLVVHVMWGNLVFTWRVMGSLGKTLRERYKWSNLHFIQRSGGCSMKSELRQKKSGNRKTSLEPLE